MKIYFLIYSFVAWMLVDWSLASDKSYYVNFDCGEVESAIAIKKTLSFKWPTKKRGEIKEVVASCSCIKRVDWSSNKKLALEAPYNFKTEISLDTSSFKNGDEVIKDIIFTVQDDELYYVHVKVNFNVVDTYSVPNIVLLDKSQLGDELLIKTKLLGGLQVVGNNPNVKLNYYDDQTGLMKVIVSQSVAKNLPWAEVMQIKGEKSEHKINFLILEKQKNE